MYLLFIVSPQQHTNIINSPTATPVPSNFSDSVWSYDVPCAPSAFPCTTFSDGSVYDIMGGSAWDKIGRSSWEQVVLVLVAMMMGFGLMEFEIESSDGSLTGADFMGMGERGRGPGK